MALSPSQQRGHQAETLACQYLSRQGLRLVTRNYRCPRGEIDLVMEDGECTVFVEVRYRRNTRFGSGADTVDSRKQRRLAGAALHYLQQRRGPAPAFTRFDVVWVQPGEGDDQLHWVRHAFDNPHP